MALALVGILKFETWDDSEQIRLDTGYNCKLSVGLSHARIHPDSRKIVRRGFSLGLSHDVLQAVPVLYTFGAAMVTVARLAVQFL
jgi:hypothetical protein